jgi:hypothetical protein
MRFNIHNAKGEKLFSANTIEEINAFKPKSKAKKNRKLHIMDTKYDKCYAHPFKWQVIL